MKKLTVVISLLLPVLFSSAQNRGSNSITGVLRDSATKAGLEYGTVTIFSKGDQKPLTGTTTDKDGFFSLSEIPPGTFTIVFECINYHPNTLNDVVTKKDAMIDLKNILLSVKKNTLKEVTVFTQGKLIENKIDKLVFNAEKDLTSQTGVATDVLKKIPQVSVDADGNVQLSGNSGIRFLINGKPSSAFGSNISDVLQSIPASQIKSVEVITNPGAKYDAQGLGGIINIILKSNTTKGYNGNLSLTAGSRMENGSLNLNARKSNFGINAFFSGNKRLKAAVTSDNYREATDSNITSTLRQASVSHFERQGFQTGIGLDWTYKKYNDFSGNISYNSFGNNGSGYTNQALQEDKASGLPEILSIVNATSDFTLHNIEAAINYKRTFAKEDQELEISISTSPEKSNTNVLSEQRSLPQDFLYYGTKTGNPATISETEYTVDYTQPLKKDVKLGVGTKANFYYIKSSSDALGYDNAIQNYQTDISLSNNLQYKQKVYAGYSELSFPAGKLFDAKIGERYERTEINAFYSNAQQQVNIPGYNTFVPSLFLLRKFGEAQTIKLSYSKRIERPDYEDLNPFVNTTDPKNLSTGNPRLQPEIGHRFELGYNRNLGKKGSLMINLFYRINDHDIQPYIIYYASYTAGDSVYSNVAVSTRQNIGRENNAGLNLFGDIHFGTKLNIRSNAFLFFRHTINAIDKGLNSNSFNYRININGSYQFTNTLLAEFFGNFNSARHEAQGSYPSFTTYSMAIRKQFWKKKGSIALTAVNPFNEYVKQKTLLFGSDFTVNNERKIPFRSIGLNFAWKFGKLEFKKAEEKDMNTNGSND